MMEESSPWPLPDGIEKLFGWLDSVEDFEDPLDDFANSFGRGFVVELWVSEGTAVATLLPELSNKQHFAPEKISNY